MKQTRQDQTVSSYIWEVQPANRRKKFLENLTRQKIDTGKFAITLVLRGNCRRNLPDKVSLVGNEDCCPASQTATALQSPQQEVRLVRLKLVHNYFAPTYCVKGTEIIHCKDNEEGMGLIGGQLKYH